MKRISKECCIAETVMKHIQTKVDDLGKKIPTFPVWCCSWDLQPHGPFPEPLWSRVWPCARVVEEEMGMAPGMWMGTAAESSHVYNVYFFSNCKRIFLLHVATLQNTRKKSLRSLLIPLQPLPGSRSTSAVSRGLQMDLLAPTQSEDCWAYRHPCRAQMSGDRWVQICIY